MEEIYTMPKDMILFLGTIFLIFFIILAVYFNVIAPFMEKRNRIKMEMQRSDGEEYYYWKGKLKKLYIEHIPIIGRFIRKANAKRKRN